MEQQTVTVNYHVHNFKKASLRYRFWACYYIMFKGGFRTPVVSQELSADEGLNNLLGDPEPLNR